MNAGAEVNSKGRCLNQSFLKGILYEQSFRFFCCLESDKNHMRHLRLQTILHLPSFFRIYFFSGQVKIFSPFILTHWDQGLAKYYFPFNVQGMPPCSVLIYRFSQILQYA